MKCGDLDGAVGEDGAGLAHHLLDLVRRQPALFVEGRRFEREVDGLQAHLALDLDAVDLAGRVADAVCAVAVLGKHRKRIERPDSCGSSCARQPAPS